MIRKAIATIILVPLAIVLVLLAIANRHAVTLSFDILSLGKPAWVLTQPLFVIVFLALLAGVIVGGIAAAPRRGRLRRAARRAEAEAHRLRAENEAMKRRLERGENLPVPRPAAPVRQLPAA